MTTKACTNSNCPAYAHFVYTVAMRCVLCRWDLKSAQRSNEAMGDNPAIPGASRLALSSKTSGTRATR